MRTWVGSVALSLATSFSAMAQLDSPGSGGPVGVFDGWQTVPVERDGPGWVRWAGSRARIDEHALVWLTPGASIDPSLGVDPVARVSPTLGLWRVRGFPGEDGLDVTVRLAGRVGRDLRAVMPDLQLAHRRLDIAVPPSDPRYPGQWFLDRIAIEEAWAIEDGSPSVTVVVVDNGCETDHPDLVAHMLGGRDVIDDDDDPAFEPGSAGNEHGTACAGIVAADTDNGVGIAGTCPECTLRCVRLLSDDPIPLSADVAAYQFALDVDAAVASSSWGFVDPVPVPGPLRAILIELAEQGRGGRGALVVFAAGNDNRRIGDGELLAVPGVIGVGATNFFDETTSFSSFGDPVDLVAPTGAVTTDLTGDEGSDPGDYTELFGGTSASAPVVAGVAGLLVSAYPDATGEEIQQALRESAAQSFFADPDESGHDDYYGYGLVQPAAALRALAAETAPDLGPELDAGLTADAGAERGGDGGCGCRTIGRPASSGLACWLIPVLLIRRRRRRRSD